MAISEGAREAIRACKEQEMGQNGVLDVQHRSAQNLNGGISVNITDLGRRIHSIGAKDQVCVVVHQDGIWIQTDE